MNLNNLNGFTLIALFAIVKSFFVCFLIQIICSLSDIECSLGFLILFYFIFCDNCSLSPVGRIVHFHIEPERAGICLGFSNFRKSKLHTHMTTAVSPHNE